MISCLVEFICENNLLSVNIVKYAASGTNWSALVLFNCLRTRVRRIQSSMHKWAICHLSSKKWRIRYCECGALDQIAANVILESPLRPTSCPQKISWIRLLLSWMTRLDTDSTNRRHHLKRTNRMKKKISSLKNNPFGLIPIKIEKEETL